MACRPCMIKLSAALQGKKPYGPSLILQWKFPSERVLKPDDNHQMAYL